MEPQPRPRSADDTGVCRPSRRSFSLIELLASAVILSILSVMGIPYAQTAKDRQVELELKQSLLRIREAIDLYAYNEVNDDPAYPLSIDGDGIRGEDGIGDPDGDGILDDDWDGRIDEDGPPTLPKKIDDLVTRGYMAQIPRDPLSEDPTKPATWTLKVVTREFDIVTDKIKVTGILDIASTSQGTSLSGVPYSKW